MEKQNNPHQDVMFSKLRISENVIQVKGIQSKLLFCTCCMRFIGVSVMCH
jgi:hypothetical protein